MSRWIQSFSAGVLGGTLLLASWGVLRAARAAQPGPTKPADHPGPGRFQDQFGGCRRPETLRSRPTCRPLDALTPTSSTRSSRKRSREARRRRDRLRLNFMYECSKPELIKDEPLVVSSSHRAATAHAQGLRPGGKPAHQG